MNKILIISAILVSTVSFNSCGYKATIEAAAAKNDSLQLVLNDRNRIIEDAFNDIEQIATSLAKITAHEKIITSSSSSDREINPTTREQISDHIAAIDELMQKNRAAINRLSVLTRQLKEANLNIASLDNLINSLQVQLQQKNTELSRMSTNLASMEIEVSGLKNLNDTLSEQNKSLETTVADQTANLNTVHWIVNSQKELQKRGVVDKKGFIGRTLVLKNVTDLDGFLTGDLRNIDRIAIDQRGAKIVSSHPEGSYELVTGENNQVQELVIKNKDAFWKTSKILVISCKNN